MSWYPEDEMLRALRAASVRAWQEFSPFVVDVQFQCSGNASDVRHCSSVQGYSKDLSCFYVCVCVCERVYLCMHSVAQVSVSVPDEPAQVEAQG